MTSFNPNSEQQSLQKAFMFTDVDLFANRTGSLSESQTKLLKTFYRLSTGLKSCQ